jgi:hypothetical protein
MKLPSSLRFAAGILRHPSQALRRLREISRIAAAPPASKVIPRDLPVEVKVISVAAPDALGRQLVDIYARNPAPYVYGPTDLEMLIRDLDKGIRYFLVLNSEGAAVGVRAFEPETKLLISSVTDFPFRGRGYQFAAAATVKKILAAEGFRLFRCAVMRDNTRQIRVLVAQGWETEPHPSKPHLKRGTLRVDADGIAVGSLGESQE